MFGGRMCEPVFNSAGIRVSPRVGARVGIWEKSVATDRVVGIEGAPWFVAEDVAHVLGYLQTDKAIRDHCRSAQRMTRPNQPGQRGGAQFFTIIPERGVYRLVMRSKLPEAAAFESWVVRAVTPAIHKVVGYVIGEEKVKTIEEDIMAMFLRALPKAHPSRSTNRSTSRAC